MRLTYSAAENRKQEQRERAALVAQRRLDRYVAETVAAAPPLTDEQRIKIRALLWGSRI